MKDGENKIIASTQDSSATSISVQDIKNAIKFLKESAAEENKEYEQWYSNVVAMCRMIEDEYTFRPVFECKHPPNFVKCKNCRHLQGGICIYLTMCTGYCVFMNGNYVVTKCFRRKEQK